MRLSWLIMMVACSSVEQVPQSDFVDGQWLRTVDTGDSGLPLEAQCTDPGFCGCDYVGYDLEAPVGDETCVHTTANVLGDIGPGARIEAGATLSTQASLGAGATLGADAFVASRATIGEDAIIGANTIVGRSASIGARSEIGADSSIGRNATIGVDVDASLGDLTLGYAASIGDRSVVTGTNVVLGNLASIGADSEIGGNVVVARAATFGDFTTLGQGTVIGPEVSALDGVTIGPNGRIRKGTTFADDVTLGSGVRIGRDSELRQNATVGDNATLRALVTVGTYYEVEEDAYIRRGTVLEDQAGAFTADEDPVVVITSPTNGANSDSGSLTLTGTVSDDFGVTSVTVRIDGGAAVSIPFSNGQFTYTVTNIPDLSQTIQVTAFDASGNQGSDVLYVSDCNPTSVSISHTWTGATSADWNTASNWSAGTIPGTSSNVFVCGDTPVQPQLAANTTLARLYMDWDANLDSNGRTLTVTSVYSGGVTSGTGTVQANSGVQLKGTVPNFVVNGDVYLSGITRATGNTTISSGTRRLRVGAHRLDLEGNFSQYISGTDHGLYLRNGLGRVQIHGNATFSGSTSMNTSSSAAPLYTGTISIGGNVSLPCSTSYDCLDPFGTHFVLNGAAPQTMTIGGGGSSGSQFHTLDIQNQQGVTVSGTLYANASVSVTNGGQLTAPNVRTGSGAATNEFSGGAVVNISSVADFAGPISVQDLSSVAIGTLQARSYFNMSPTSSYSGTTVNLYSQLVIPSDDYTATNTVVHGDLTVHNDWDHTLPLLTVTGSGRLRVNGKTMVLHGNYAQYISATDVGLYLRNTLDDVTITGNASFSGSTSMNTSSSAAPMYTGTVRIAGNVSMPCSTSYDCLDPYGTHFILNGTEPQTLTISGGGSSGSQFHSLEIQNQDGVTASGTLYATSSFSVTNGGHFSAPNVYTGSSTGQNVFSDGAVVNISSVADIAGPIQVLDTSSLTVSTLFARSYFNMSPTSSYDGTTVNLYSQLVIPSNDYTATNTVVHGDLTVHDDWDHTVPLLTVTGPGRLRVNGKTMVLHGNYAQYISATDVGLYLRNTLDDVTITGNASFSGSTSMNTSSSAAPMYTGTVRIAGNVSMPCSTSYDCLDPFGTHFILNGTEPQTLTISGGGSSGSQFHSLEIQNQDGVTASGTLYATSSFSVTNGGHFSAPNVYTGSSTGQNVFSDGAVVNISSVADIAGPIQVLDTSSLTVSTLHARSYLNMSPASSYTGTTVNLYSQLVIPSDDYNATNTVVHGDLTVHNDWDHTLPLLTVTGSGRLRVNGKTMVLDGNYAQYISATDVGLYLRNTLDDVTITGNASFSGSTSMNTSSSAAPMYTGTVRIAGNMSMPCSTSHDCLDPFGTRFVLNGTSPQTVSFSGGGSSGSQFHAVEFANTAGTTISGTLYAGSDIDVTGTLTNNGSATTNGNLTIDGGVLNNNGTFNYNGTYTNTGTLNGNTPVNY